MNEFMPVNEPLLNGNEKEPIIARVGNYGPYIQQGDVRRNIPDILAPGVMTSLF